MPPQKISKKLSRGKVFLLVLAILIFSGLTTFLSQQISKHQTKDAINKITQHFSLSEHFVLGSTNKCIEQGPSNFGDINGLKICYYTTAVAYFPSIKVSDYTQPDGITSVSYVATSSQGKIVYEDLSELSNIDKNNDLSLENQIGIDKRDRLSFSGVDIKTDKKLHPGWKLIDESWKWTSVTGWLGQDPDNKKLQEGINQKIYSNTKLANGAPSTSEALNSGRAPLIVYITDRYCHSPKIILLDHACILPN